MDVIVPSVDGAMDGAIIGLLVGCTDGWYDGNVDINQFNCNTLAAADNMVASLYLRGLCLVFVTRNNWESSTINGNHYQPSHLNEIIQWLRRRTAKRTKANYRLMFIQVL